MSNLKFRMETIAFKMMGKTPAATAPRARNFNGEYTNLRNESRSSKPEAIEYGLGHLFWCFSSPYTLTFASSLAWFRALTVTTKPIIEKKKAFAY